MTTESSLYGLNDTTITVESPEDTQTAKAVALHEAIGNMSDAAATSNSGQFSLIALVKRLLGKLPEALTAAGSLKVALMEGGPITVLPVMTGVTTNISSSAVAVNKGRRTFQASISGTGAVSATVTWYGSHQNTNTSGVLLSTMSLTGTDADIAGEDIPGQWPYVWTKVEDITGTGATVNTSIGL
jgi:hypothetical protein